MIETTFCLRGARLTTHGRDMLNIAPSRQIEPPTIGASADRLIAISQLQISHKIHWLEASHRSAAEAAAKREGLTTPVANSPQLGIAGWQSRNVHGTTAKLQPRAHTLPDKTGHRGHEATHGETKRGGGQ